MAAFPTAADHPQMSGGYIPRIYDKRLLIEFYKNTVFGAISNHDHEALVAKGGDTVRIRQQPDITGRDYTKGQNLQYDKLDPGFIDLEINKGKYIGYKINKVDEAQSDLEFVSLWTPHAAKELQILIDRDVLANVYADSHDSNQGATAGVDSGDIDLGVSGTPLQMTKTNILEIMADCATVLDEQDVPEEGRWIVLPSWARGLFMKGDLKDAGLAGDDVSIMRNGRVGTVANFTIYMSNNLAKTTDGSDTVFNSMFGTTAALTFATQIKENEILVDQVDFGKLVRTLQVYGYKVVKPEAMGHLYIKK